MSKRFRRTIRAAVIGVLLALSTTACVGPTPEEQTTTVQFEGGKFIRTAPVFSDCVQGGTKGEYDFGGREFTYPGDQRNVDFRGIKKVSDRGPIRVVSNDGIEMDVYGILQYDLNTECTDKDSPLVAFHQEIGRRFNASFEEGPNKVPGGWLTIQDKYIENPMERVVIAAAKPHKAGDLWRNGTTIDTVSTVVNGTLPKAVDIDTPTNEEFFQGLRFAITKIDPAGTRGEELKATYAAAENEAAKARGRETTAVANKKAAEAEVATEVAKAQAEVAVATAKAAAKRIDISPYGSVEEYRKAILSEAGINPDLIYGTTPTLTKPVE